MLSVDQVFFVKANTCDVLSDSWSKALLYSIMPFLSSYYPITDLNIGIKPGLSCINIRQVPREVLKTEAGGRGFQHLHRELANVNALTNHVRSLLLHKN